MEAARQKTFLKYSIAVSDREKDFEKSTEYILHLYPTRDDFVRNRGSIFIHYLEISGEENILSWIDYQELKIQLTGNRRCMKNQTLDERNIINKGLQIHKYIYNVYKKLRFKCYNRFSEKTPEEKATIVIQQMKHDMNPEIYKRAL